MTIIKQRAVSAKSHAKHLRAYINDERALMRDVQNIARREAWFKEMDETREVAGHNTAARKGAKNTVMYHQVLAFLPEECDVNGGRLTPELCMVYAKEYAQTRNSHRTSCARRSPAAPEAGMSGQRRRRGHRRSSAHPIGGTESDKHGTR